jgi:hypothetical protein
MVAYHSWWLNGISGSGAKVIHGTHSSLRSYCTATVEDMMAEELACPKCASISVVYHDAPNENAAEMCGGCGMFLSTRGQFRQLLERQAVESQLVTTEC